MAVQTYVFLLDLQAFCKRALSAQGSLLLSLVHFTLLLLKAHTQHLIFHGRIWQLFGAEDIFLFYCGYFSLWILNEWMCSNLIGASGVGIRWPGYLHLVNNVLIHVVWQHAGSWP